MKSILDKLKEPSSYAGLGVTLASLGWFGFGPEEWQAILVAIAGVFGVVAIFLKEKSS